MSRRKKPGRRPMVQGGLTEVLFVRSSKKLIRALDRRLESESARNPGRTLSRADIVREILYQALEDPPR